MSADIQELLNAPTSGEHAPSLARMEDALTEGYAQALALEAERLRLQQRIGEVARAADGEVAEEIRSLARRITHADGELMKLRTLLGSLHDRARHARLASR